MRTDLPPAYQPLTLRLLAEHSKGLPDAERWRLIAEFLEDYRWETADNRSRLIAQEPAETESVRWDVFLAALAEHLAAQQGAGAPSWANRRFLQQFWFPFNTKAARVDALVHAPAAFRRRGVFIAPQELNVA